MPGRFEYAVLGKGRWAAVMHDILAQHSKAVVVGETRSYPGELREDYRLRMAKALSATGAQAAWLCIPPCPETPLLAAAAVDCGMHVVAEKPWRWGSQEDLLTRSAAKGTQIAVHYEYCLLEAFQRWRESYGSGQGFGFSGRFRSPRPDRLRIPALENLGSHLFAIHAYCAPAAKILAIDCGYEQAGARQASLTKGGKTIASVNFMNSREPIIERFIELFEKAAEGRATLPFTLEFACRVQQSFLAFEKNEQKNLDSPFLPHL